MDKCITSYTSSEMFEILKERNQLRIERDALVRYVKVVWTDSLSKETQEAWKAIPEATRKEIEDAG